METNNFMGFFLDFADEDMLESTAVVAGFAAVQFKPFVA